MILLSPEDAELLKMSHLQIAARSLRNGGAPDMADVCDTADATIKAQAAEIVKLKLALEPFAKEAQHWSDKWPDDTQVSVHQRGAGCDQCGADPGCETHDIKVSDLRRARSALTSKASA